MIDPLDRALRGLAVFHSRRLADLARARGWIAEPQVAEVAAAGGLDAAGRLLLERRWVTASQLAELLLAIREQDAPSSPIPPPPEASEAARNPDRVLDAYVLVVEVGRGAAGTVWKAWDRTLCRWVAVKTLAEGSPTEARERFLREAQAAARLKHPDLVTVYGSGFARERSYVVMEFIDGKPLAIDGPIRDRVERVRRIAAAVGEAHRAGIVHRDLKPANVLIDARGEPHVVDFGLAHFSESAARMTKTGSVLGTPRYMAPEQVQGRAADIGPAADVYALGAILYEQLTGKPPHDAETLPQLYSRIVAEDPVSPRRRSPEVSHDMEVICLKALEKDPKRRYADAGALAEDLGRSLRGEPIVARPPGIAIRARRALWRHRIALAAAVLLLAAAGGGFRFWRASDLQARYSAAVEAGLERWNEMVGRIRPAGPTAFPELDEAIAHFERAAQIRPERGEPWLWIGRCRLLAGDPEAAERAWSEGIARDPGHGPLRIERAGCYVAEVLRTRRPPVTLQGTRTPRFRPQRPETPAEASWRKRAEDDLRAAVRPAGMSSADREVLESLLLMCGGRFEQVYLDLHGSLKGRTWDHRILGIFGTAAYQGGHPHAAVEALGQAIRINPRACWLVARGHAYLTLGAGQEALADYDAALERAPGDPDILAARALALHLLGRSRDAESQLTLLVDQHPGDGSMFLNRGRIRADRRDLEGAERDFREAVRLSPSWAEAYSNLGGVLILKGRIEEALVELDTAVGLDEHFLDARRNRGLARMALGRVKEALEDYQAVCDGDDTDFESRFHLAEAYGQLGMTLKAVEELDTVLTQAPADWPRRAQAEALRKEWAKRPK